MIGEGVNIPLILLAMLQLSRPLTKKLFCCKEVTMLANFLGTLFSLEAIQRYYLTQIQVPPF